MQEDTASDDKYKNLSDTETFYYSVQNKLNGNVPWGKLNTQHQLMFVQSINVIKQLASARE